MEDRTNRREFLKGLGLIGGFTAMLFVMPLVPMEKLYRKLTGKSRYDELKEIYDPPLPYKEPEQYLWQTEKFQDRKIEITGSGQHDGTWFRQTVIDEKPKDFGIKLDGNGSTLDEFKKRWEPHPGKTLKQKMEDVWKHCDRNGGDPEFIIISEENLRNMIPDLQKYIKQHPRWQQAPDRAFWTYT